MGFSDDIFNEENAKAVKNSVKISRGITSGSAALLTIAESNGARIARNNLRRLNKSFVPAVVAIESIKLGYNAKQDFDHGTSRNTVNSLATTGGGIAGGYGGGLTGAALGTMICPGFGTATGAIIGGLFGGWFGSEGAEKAVDYIADELEYDVARYRCKHCKEYYTCRKYTNQSRNYCPDCE